MTTAQDLAQQGIREATTPLPPPHMSSLTVRIVVTITQADYDALPSKDESTLYVIVG